MAKLIYFVLFNCLCRLHPQVLSITEMRNGQHRRAHNGCCKRAQSAMAAIVPGVENGHSGWNRNKPQGVKTLPWLRSIKVQSTVQSRIALSKGGDQLSSAIALISMWARSSKWWPSQYWGNAKLCCKAQAHELQFEHEAQMAACQKLRSAMLQYWPTERTRLHTTWLSMNTEAAATKPEKQKQSCCLYSAGMEKQECKAPPVNADIGWLLSDENSKQPPNQLSGSAKLHAKLFRLWEARSSSRSKPSPHGVKLHATLESLLFNGRYQTTMDTSRELGHPVQSSLSLQQGKGRIHQGVESALSLTI